MRSRLLYVCMSLYFILYYQVELRLVSPVVCISLLCAYTCLSIQYDTEYISQSFKYMHTHTWYALFIHTYAPTQEIFNTYYETDKRLIDFLYRKFGGIIADVTSSSSDLNSDSSRGGRGGGLKADVMERSILEW